MSVIRSIVLAMLFFWVAPLYAQDPWFSKTDQCAGNQGDNSNTCSWADIDNDGDQDLFVGRGYSENGEASYLYMNQWREGSGDFIPIQDVSFSPPYISNNPTASCWGDYDNDNLLDLLIVGGGDRAYPAVLYRNLGLNENYIPHFESVQEGLFGYPMDALGAIWGDFDNDGNLDILEVIAGGGGPNYIMYRNQGRTLGYSFVAQNWRPQGDVPYIASDVTAADIDNDGDLDIFVTNAAQPSKLYRNLLAENGQAWVFDELSGPFNLSGTGAAFCDYDYDSDYDLFVTGLSGNHLFQNNGATFSDVTEDERLNLSLGANGASWADFDLDGDQDLFLNNRGGYFDYIYLNNHRDNQNNFSEIAFSLSGLGDMANTLCAEWAEKNGDGKPDLFTGNHIVNMATDSSQLYVNAYFEHQEFNYIDIKLIGCETNRAAIGAAVELRYPFGTGRIKTRAQVSGGGTGSGSQGSLPLEFGVGTLTSIDSIIVYWPSGDTSLIENVAPRQRITIVEHGNINGDSAQGMNWNSNIDGDYYLSGSLNFYNGAELTTSKANVLFHRYWRTNALPRIGISNYAAFRGYDSNFLSQYNPPAPGDWTGIYLNGYPTMFNMLKCRVQYAINGVFSPTGCSPDSFYIGQSRFRQMTTSAIDLQSPAYLDRLIIERCPIDTCGNYGIRIRNDGSYTYPPIIIAGNSIRWCKYGIWYSGNGSPLNSRITQIRENTINATVQATAYYGIYVSKYNSAGTPPYVYLSCNSVSGFPQAGMLLNSVDASSRLDSNIVEYNSGYGLSLINSSPSIGNSDIADSNVFNSNNTGIRCDKYSAPKIRWAKMRRNFKNGILIDSRLVGTPAPNLGTQVSMGMNSFTSVPSALYYDVRNNITGLTVSAMGNWWGEWPVNTNQIYGPVDYSFSLEMDPSEGFGRRDPGNIELPVTFILNQNVPNPFNPETQIVYFLPYDSDISLNIYNINGQLVRSLSEGFQNAGDHVAIWNGKNRENRAVASGIYFYVLATAEGKITKRMTLLR
jgi:hypothetical protein